MSEQYFQTCKRFCSIYEHQPGVLGGWRILNNNLDTLTYSFYAMNERIELLAEFNCNKKCHMFGICNKIVLEWMSEVEGSLPNDSVISAEKFFPNEAN